VADSHAPLTFTSKDFKERSSTVYAYGPNGNLSSSLDKQISSISYNHLNLPKGVVFNTGAKLAYSYDADEDGALKISPFGLI